MATVFQGKDEKKNQTVAIKVLKPMLASDDTLRQRFEREYEVCCRLDHKNIIKVFGAGLVNDNLPYCVLEFLPFPNLSAQLKEKGVFVASKVSSILFSLAQALQHCHERDVIHRDIKPENIIITKDGRPVLVDFGLTLDTAAYTKLTAVGKTLGTPPYMSPEQFKAQKVDGRSDIYQLGLVGYELLTGKRAFPQEEMEDLVHHVFRVGPIPIEEAAPDTPEELIDIIERASEPHIEERFPNAAEMAKALGSLGQNAKRGSSQAVPLPHININTFVAILLLLVFLFLLW